MAIGNPITLTNNVASKTISVTATADQTLFTVTGGYRVNQLSVFRNGVQLSQSSDYTANDGSSVTLVSAANAGDTLLFEIFDTFKVAEAIQPSVANQTINGNLTVTGTLTGAQIGIQSAGTAVGAAKTLNFIGVGNTFLDNGDGTIDVSISGSGGGGLGTAINYSDGTASPFSYIDRYAQIPEDMLLDATVAGVDTSIIVSVVPNIQINAGAAVTVGTGKTMIIDVLQIGDL
jgi:DNA/RNA endonuclease YhcR with UshA esterase domain